MVYDGISLALALSTFSLVLHHDYDHNHDHDKRGHLRRTATATTQRHLCLRRQTTEEENVKYGIDKKRRMCKAICTYERDGFEGHRHDCDESTECALVIGRTRVTREILEFANNKCLSFASAERCSVEPKHQAIYIYIYIYCGQGRHWKIVGNKSITATTQMRRKWVNIAKSDVHCSDGFPGWRDGKSPTNNALHEGHAPRVAVICVRTHASIDASMLFKNNKQLLLMEAHRFSPTINISASRIPEDMMSTNGAVALLAPSVASSYQEFVQSSSSQTSSSGQCNHDMMFAAGTCHARASPIDMI